MLRRKLDKITTILNVTSKRKNKKRFCEKGLAYILFKYVITQKEGEK